MFSNKLTYPLVLAVLLVAVLAFVAIPETAAVTPVLSVPDEVADDTNDPNTQGIQRYGIRGESVPIPLTITFQHDHTDPNPVNIPVVGFDSQDIVLVAADSRGTVVPIATPSTVRPNADGSVYTTQIIATANVNTVIINVPQGVANTPGRWDPAAGGGVGQIVGNEPTAAAQQTVVNIIRSAAPPLTLSPDRLIGGNAPFTVTLTSTTPITLTPADIKITGGSIDSLSSDAGKRVWTVTIRPGVGITQLTVEPSATGSFIFPNDERSKGTFTVDTTGPTATIAGTPPAGGGTFPITITFNESLQTGTTLSASEIVVSRGTISEPIAIPDTNRYYTFLTPDSGVTTVEVQVNAGAVADTGGILNTATPSPAHTFRVTPTGARPATTPTQGSVRDLTTGEVTISEIMFATDGGTNDIQWIELFNSSKSEAVALDADSGWELIIENYDDPRSARAPLSGAINFKDSGSVKTIAPRQTVLIVSAGGRNSGTTNAKRQPHFVATRVFEVYSELGTTEFGIRSRRDAFLNPTEGFHIQLIDGRNNLADQVGNLDGRTRTADAPAWRLPNGWTLDNKRTSILRRYRGGTAHDGTRREGWIPAAETSLLYLLERKLDMWYGSSSDHGSPGIHDGGALPVQLSHFRPDLTEAGTVVIQWTTESEVNNAGFNILRSQTRTGEFKVINTQLIPGAGTTSERNTYTWTDTTAKPNVACYYQIEDVSLGGERQTLATVRLRGFVSAKDKLTTQWGQLKRLRD